jgi:hypothetical protein
MTLEQKETFTMRHELETAFAETEGRKLPERAIRALEGIASFDGAIDELGGYLDGAGTTVAAALRTPETMRRESRSVADILDSIDGRLASLAKSEATIATALKSLAKKFDDAR